MQGAWAAGKRELTQLWFTTTNMLLEVAEYQARFADALDLSTRGIKDASQVLSGFWVRVFYLQRARIYLKLRQLEESASDCECVLRLYVSADCEDLGLVSTMLLQASVMREKAATRNAIEALNMIKRGTIIQFT
jgi:hypothetical protein